MAGRSQRPLPESKVLSADDLKSGIRKIDRRLEDLTSFDVRSIQERFDAKTQALTDKINDTLADIFGRDTPSYNNYSIWSLDTLPLIVGGGDHSLKEVQESYAKGIADAVTKLTSLRETLQEKLDDIEESSRAVKVQASKATTSGNRKVFIVHGRDELFKETAARFISKFGLDPIILHEQANQGKTIIEKLEANIDVDFAVVLLTPDDIGYSAENPERKSPRARQNVILELGLFIGALGRDRVCALYKDEVEIPSDYRGVVFIRVDEGGAWQLALAREIKESGIEIDLNKAIS